MRVTADHPDRLSMIETGKQNLHPDSKRKPLRVGIITEFFYPNLGGVTEHVYHLSRRLALRGHQVDIITSRVRNPLKKGDEAPPQGLVPGQNLVRVGPGIPVISNGSLASVTISLSLGKKLTKLFAEKQYDLVHIHSPYGPVLPFLSIKYCPAPMIGTIHTNFETNIHANTWVKYLKLYLDQFDGMMAVSETAVHAFKKYYQKEFRVIPNGVDTQWFQKDIQPLPFLQDGRTNILFIGRLDPRNGLHFLIEAFAKIHPEFPRTRLVIIGDGPLRRVYENMIPESLRDSVYFAGYINRERPSYFAHCQVMCFPAIIAAFSVTILEGMAAGLPIVASRIPGFLDAFIENENGLMFSVGNIDDLAQTLKKLLSDSALQGRLSQASLQSAARYDWDRVVDQIESYYFEVLSRFPSGKS